MEFYQVVSTDKSGNVKGKTFADPIVAIKCFSDRIKNKNRFSEVLFRELGSTVSTIADDELEFAEYKESQLGNTVTFYSHTTRAEMLSRLSDYVIPAGYVGRYYSKVVLYDLKKQEVVQTFEQRA